MKRTCARLVLIVLLFTCHFSLAPAEDIDVATLTAECDRLLAAQFPQTGPGATALIAQNGKILYSKAFGMANIELNVPMQVDHVFRIGSITKQFTAVAILKLIEQGKLNLQDEITTFLPDYPTQGNTITIEHLLTHTSGIQDYSKLASNPGRGNNSYTPVEMIDHFKNHPMRFTPGTRMDYSNSGYFLLGYIIEVVSGETYGHFLQENIFKPIGMNHSSVADDIAIVMNRADGYSQHDQNIVNAQYISMTAPYAAGAILSTVGDLFRWNRAIHSYDIITKASLEKALSRYTLANGEETNYGYGWRFGYIQDSPSIWHGGLINGFITMDMYLPEEDVYVAVFSNCDCNSPEDVTAKLAALAIGEPYEYEAIALDDGTLSEYAGVYENAKGQLRVISVSGRQLHSQLGRGPLAQLAPYAMDKFVFEDDDMSQIHFDRGRDGEVVKLTAKNRETQMVWNKSQKPVPSQNGIELDDEILQLYVGEYQISPEFSFVVTRDGKRMFVQATGQDALEIYADSDSTFFLKVNDAELTFVRDESGSVIMAKLTQGGRSTDAKKIR